MSCELVKLYSTFISCPVWLVYWLWSCVGGSEGKKSACSVGEAGDVGLIPEWGRFPWRRAWQPAPVFLPGEFPWREEPGGLQPMGSQSRTWLEWLSTHMQVLLPLLWKVRMKLPRNPSHPPLGKVPTQHILHWQQERTAHQGWVSNHTAGKQSVSFSKVIPCQWVYFWRSKTTAGNFCSLC